MFGEQIQENENSVFKIERDCSAFTEEKMLASELPETNLSKLREIIKEKLEGEAES
jgi:hypothetical protein